MSVRGVNKVILVGFLGQDPEIRYLPNNGGAVAGLSLATADTWRDKQSGEQRERTEWHRVVIFGKLAEIAGEYLHKGSQIYIEGALRTRKWQDSAGQDRYTTEIVVSQQGAMQMLGGANKSKNDAGSSQSSAWGTPQQPVAPAQSGQSFQQSMGNEPPMDFDDIPFLGYGYGVCRGTLYSIS